MAACKPVFVLVAMLSLASTAPSTSVSDLEQMVTILESNYRQETQKQANLTNSLLKELSKATKERQILEQTITGLQTQIHAQEQHYQGVVAGLLARAALTEDKLGNLTRVCNSSFAELGSVKGQVRDMKTNMKNQDKDITDLKKMMNGTEIRVNKQDEDLKDFTTKTTDKLASLSTTSSTLQVAVTSLQGNESLYGAAISNLASKVDLATENKSLPLAYTNCNSDLNQLKKDLTSNVSSLTNSLAQTTKQGQDLVTEVSGLQKVVDAIQSNRRKVAGFTGILKQSSTFNKDDIVRFSRISFNLGDHYNSSTGIFTCPYSGVYVFHLHAMGFRDAQFHLQIIRPGYYVPGVYSGDVSAGYQHASNTNIMNMRGGEEVTVKSKMDQSKVLGGTFSAFLLYAH